jgi:predicted permease
VIPEILMVVPIVGYVAVILLGHDGADDEYVVPYLVAQAAAFVQYMYALHLRFKHHDGGRQ